MSLLVDADSRDENYMFLINIKDQIFHKLGLRTEISCHKFYKIHITRLYMLFNISVI